MDKNGLMSGPWTDGFYLWKHSQVGLRPDLAAAGSALESMVHNPVTEAINLVLTPVRKDMTPGPWSVELTLGQGINSGSKDSSSIPGCVDRYGS